MSLVLQQGAARRAAWRSAVAAGLMGCAMAAAAASFGFEGTAMVVPTGLPDAEGNLPLQVTSRTSHYSFGGARRWRLESRFVSNIVTGVGNGAFRYYSGADELSGSVAMLLIPGTEFGAFDLNYTVETGGGRLAGFSGTGRATVTLLGPQTQPPTPYEETGRFDIFRGSPAADDRALTELGIRR